MAQQSAATLFAKNMVAAHICVQLFDQGPRPTPSLNTKWLLRAAVVFAVSALDTYVHDKIKYRVGRLSLQDLPPQLARFEIPLSELPVWQAAERKGNVLRNWVTASLGSRTLQSPTEIAEALKLIGIHDFWSTIAGSPPAAKVMKDHLNSLVRRRNQIAHEGDRLQSRRSGKKLRPIGRKAVVAWLGFVEHIVDRAEEHFPR